MRATERRPSFQRCQAVAMPFVLWIEPGLTIQRPSMPLSRLFAPCAVASLLAACGSSPVSALPAGLEHAAAARQCGLADGPAVSIYLAAAPVASLEPSSPYVRIDIWQPVQRVAERTWIFTEMAEEGAALYFLPGGDHEVAASGRVSVTGVAEDTTLVGSMTIDFPSAGRIEGDFSARWIHRTMLCG